MIQKYSSNFSFFFFIISIRSRKVLLWGEVFECDFLIDLHFLKFCELKNQYFQRLVYVFVINISWKQIIAGCPDLMYYRYTHVSTTEKSSEYHTNSPYAEAHKIFRMHYGLWRKYFIKNLNFKTQEINIYSSQLQKSVFSKIRNTWRLWFIV